MERSQLTSALTFCLLSLFLVLPSASISQAQEANTGLYIKIGEASLKKSLLALPNFNATGSPTEVRNSARVGKELYDVFRNNMEVSNYFELIKPDAYLEDTSKVGMRPAPGEAGGFKFDSWKQIGAEFLIRAGYRVSGNDVTLNAFAYHVPQQKLILEETYRGKISDARTISHRFGNDLIRALTGQKGFFLSRIVTSRSINSQQKEIFVMDWDGANATQVSSHRSIAQSPTWSYDGKKIAYSAFAYHPKEKTRNLDLFTLDLETRKQSLVSYRRGLNSGASFMPDNRNLLLTISNAGNPDIYRMGLDGRNLVRLTTARSGEMNVEPSPSPDGRRIAFSSTRSGRPMIFVMNSDGGNIQRLTFAGEYNSSPAWSPDGKKIAFAGFDKSHFDIFVMDADGTNMVRLTSARKPNGRMANNEDPSFSPDGRHILFRSDRTGRYQLYIVSIDGENERRITFDQHEYFRPRWSPSFE